MAVNDPLAAARVKVGDDPRRDKNPHGEDEGRRPSRRRTARRVALLTAVSMFLALRVASLQVPLNSDDMLYLQAAGNLLAGDHPIRAGRDAGEHTHLDLRLGVVVPLAVLRLLTGSDQMAYHAFPLLVSGASFVTILLVADARWGPLVAILLAWMHGLNPLAADSFAFPLPNLLAALLALWFFLTCRAASERAGRARLVALSTTAFLAFWLYEVRDGEVVLLLPGLVVLGVADRRFRDLATVVVAVTAAVLIEQGVYWLNGFPPGHRWIQLGQDVRAYLPALEHSNLRYYLVRPLVMAHVHWGATGAALLVAWMLCQAHLVTRGSDVTLRAFSATALCSALVMSYWVFGRHEGLLLLLNSSPRYLDTFYLGGILAMGPAVAACLHGVPEGAEATRALARTALGGLLTAAFVTGLWRSCERTERLWGSDVRKAARIVRSAPVPAGTGVLAPRTSLRLARLFLPNARLSVLSRRSDAASPRAATGWVWVDWKREALSCGFVSDPEACSAALGDLRAALTNSCAGALSGPEIHLYSCADPGWLPASFGWVADGS